MFLGIATSFQKSNIDWPQQPPTEKLPKFNIIFHDSIPKNFFQNTNIKLNSNLKSSVVIFQALTPASITSLASTASMASMTSKASFHQKIY